MLRNFIKIIVTILLIVLLNHCGQKSYSLEDVEGMVKTVNSNLHGLKGKKYEWASKKAYSDVSAYFPLPGFMLLNEKIRFRTGGDSFNLYYFKNGVLVYYRERKQTFLKTDGTHWQKVLTFLDLYLDQNGNVVGVENIEGKKKVDLKGAQLTDILTHSNELYTIVNPEDSN